MPNLIEHGQNLNDLAAKLAGVHAVIKMMAEGAGCDEDALYLVNDVVEKVNFEMCEIAEAIIALSTDCRGGCGIVAEVFIVVRYAAVKHLE